MTKKSNVVPNKVFVGLPWKNVKPKYESCIDDLRASSPIYFHIVGRDDSQTAEDLLGRIKNELDTSSRAIFDATSGNPNVSLEYGYAEAKEIDKALYLSDHRSAHKGSSASSPIISDLAGKKQNRYKNEKRLKELLTEFSRQHPYTLRYEAFIKSKARGRGGPKAKSLRALALRVIHSLDGKLSRRRADIVNELQGQGYDQSEINQMIRALHSAKLIKSKQGPHSTVVIQ